MPDPCASLVLSLELLEKQRDSLFQALADGKGDSIALHKQLQNIGAGIVTVNSLLKDCRANSSTPSPTAFALAEHNQSIQFFEVPYYNYPAVGQIPPQNNTVALVAKKETMIRLYIDAPGSSSLTGTLQFATPAGDVSIAPLSPTLSGRALNAINRLDLSHTLNFVMPSQYCHGSFSYTVDIVDAANGQMISTPSIGISFVAVPPVKVHCVLIHYTGLDFFDNPVDQTVDSDGILGALNGVLAAYPISDFDFSGCDVIQWDEQMKFADSWEDLLSVIATMRDQSGTDAIFLGFVPEKANCGGVCGKGRIGGGACIFFAGPMTDPIGGICHEMGHAIGRKHAPECLPSGEEGDTNYPNYGPLFPRASIGGIGLDMRDLSPSGQLTAIKDPSQIRDYMSYCPPPWTSPYGYMFALDQFRSGRFTDRTSEQWAVRESYFIRLHIDRSGKRIHIKSAFHLDAPQPVSNGQLFSRVRARVYSTDGVLMCSAYATIEEDDRTIQPENLKLTFLCMPGMRRFLLDEDSTPLGEFVFAEKPPELKVHVAKPPRRAARWLKVTWKASAPRDAKPGLVFSVRYSADGKEWRPVAVNLTKSELLIDLDRLPGGPECRVQVIASAGFRTTVQESSRFAVPVKGRSIFVQSPSPDATYPSGSPLTLVAAAYSPNFGSAYGDDIQWTSTTLGLLGTGNRLTVPGLPAGKHWIRVHAPDGQGARVSREVPITVVNCAHGSPPRPPFLHRPCRCGH